MPDIDPDSIPVLDDIIKKTDDVKTPKTALEDTDNNHDLLSIASLTKNLPVDDLAGKEGKPTKPASEKQEPTIETSSIDILNTDYTDNIFNNDTSESFSVAPGKLAETDPAPVESALIDYDAEEITEKQTIISNPAIPTLTETLSLQTITDDIVKQLMPKLENQLRLLIEQALAEKLREEIINTAANISNNK